MVTRIVHISDLHFPSRDETVAQVLQDAIVQKQPNLLIVTGDLANHPSMWWLFKKGRWIAAQGWLSEVNQKLEGRLTILVLPGNHDVLVFGLTGWCWPARKAFSHVFGEWYRPGVYLDAKARITFLTLDTNPWAARFSAEGKALRSRLNRLKRNMERHPEAAQIRTSTKILLMHHHPLPVPFHGGDWLLQTRRVDRLLRFVAENRIDLILHGHKHRATWSHLRVGGTSGEPFFLEVVGAGAAMKKSDYDPRGHNLNLIDIAASGVRQIRQFFKQPGGEHFDEAKPSRAEEGVSRLIQFEFRQPYRVRRLTWRVQADEEGDGRNELILEGLVFNRSADTYEVPLPENDVETGEVQPYRPVEISPVELGGKLDQRKVNGKDRTCVTFTQQPTDQTAAHVEVENYDLNAYAMDRREAAERGLHDTERDYMELLLTDPVEELHFEADFPDRFRFRNARLEVLEPLERPDVVHQRLTHEFSQVVQADGNHLRAKLSLPPPNYRYHLSWEIPPASQTTEEWNAAYARRNRFEQVYLALVSSADPGPLNAIIEAFQDMYSALEQRISAAISAATSVSILDETTDLSVMVCDRNSAAPLKLRLVFWNRQTNYPGVFRDFRLAIGEGNAGRAYKTGTLRLFDKYLAQNNPKANTYRKLEDGPDHVFLLSVPLLDPVSGFPLAVLNLGTSSAPHADFMRALKKQDFMELAGAMHREPLTRLLFAAGLK